ncbi:MAG: TspO/MBR family protein [Bacteroidota bacterium]
MIRIFQVRYLNVLFLFLTLYINYVSVTGGLGGKSIRELSDKYDNLFTPAPQTFGIWSVIYSLLLIVTIRAIFIKQNSSTSSPYLFILSCLLNGTWIVAWQLEFIALSLIIMLGLLFVLAKITLQQDIQTPLIEKITFGIYLGWICIATIANTTTQLVSIDISISAEVQRQITQTIIIIGAGIALWVSRSLKNWAVLLPVIWAFYGIYTKRSTDYPTIALVAAGSAVFILLLGVVLFLKKQFK